MYNDHEKTNLDHIRSNETNTTVPALGRVVQHVVHTEAVVLLCQSVQFVLEQDILRVDVGKDQVNLGGVVASVAGSVTDDGLDDLEHGGDTGTTSDHTNVSAHVGGVDHGSLGSAHLHLISDLHVGQVPGDIALGVFLDQQIEVTGLIVRGDRGVRAHNLLGVSGDRSSERDVLADGQSQDVRGTRKGEAVDSDIVRDEGLLLERELLELIGGEHLARA